MKTVIVSPEFQIAIPSEMCRRLNIRPEDNLKARVQGWHIELIPEQPMTAARGFLAGLDTEIERRQDRV